MANKDIVVIGASTGGIEALQNIVGGLPGDSAASIFVVLHSGPSSPNVLDKILQKSCPLTVSNARHGEQILPGKVYVAPADSHLLLDATGYVCLTHGPKENRFRPAIDPLFRSAARAFGSRTVGVVLTGNLDDGTAGLWAIKERGGTAIVQSPEEAVAPSMPLNALKHVDVDYCLPLDRIAPVIAELAQTPMGEQGRKPISKILETEVKIAEENTAEEIGVMDLGNPSLFACPECHGVLIEIEEGGRFRFRCHTGHAYSAESLLAAFTESTEDTLWNAIRSIEETALLMRRMAGHLEKHQHTAAAAALSRKAEATRKGGNLVRQALIQEGVFAAETVKIPRDAIGQ